MQEFMKHREDIKNNVLKSFGMEGNEIQKARSGIYADTAENRKLSRVGQKFGNVPKEKEKPEGKGNNNPKEKPEGKGNNNPKPEKMDWDDNFEDNMSRLGKERFEKFKKDAAAKIGCRASSITLIQPKSNKPWYNVEDYFPKGSEIKQTEITIPSIKRSSVKEVEVNDKKYISVTENGTKDIYLFGSKPKKMNYDDFTVKEFLTLDKSGKYKKFLGDVAAELGCKESDISLVKPDTNAPAYNLIEQFEGVQVEETKSKIPAFDKGDNVTEVTFDGQKYIVVTEADGRDTFVYGNKNDK